MPGPAVTVNDIKQAARALTPFLPERAWLPWRVTILPNGKMDKPPACGANTAIPSTWRTLDAVCDELTRVRDVAGIGFAITRNVITLDFDKCRDPVTGTLTDEAQGELERISSYAYVTPSHTGFRIVGTNSVVQPIPGRKSKLVLPGGTELEIFVGPTNHYNTFTHETLDGYETVKDISEFVLDYLVSLPSKSEGTPNTSADPQRSIEAIQAALAVIPNACRDWDHWVKVGMAAWRSSGGSGDGLEAWRGWSAKHEAHDDAACDDRWQHFHRSPPTRIGFGTLYHMARQANPFFVAPYDELVGTSPGHVPNVPASERPQEPRAKRILTIAEVEALPPPVWLVDGLVPERSLVIPYGPPKKGKTFIVLSMALHIAASLDWMGRRVDGGGVVYIAGEGIGGFGLRIKAMRAHYGIDANIPFWVIPRAVNFSDKNAIVELVKLVRDTVLDEPISLVVVDTLARAMPGVDENSSQEVGAVIAACDAIKHEMACTVMPIHHAGKDAAKGLRGSSAIHGAVDASFQIDGTGKSVTLTPTDQKDADPGQAMTFDMVEVAVGLGRSSLVPVLSNAPGTPPGHAGTWVMSLQEKLALDALRNALSEHARIVTGSSNVPGNVPTSIPICLDSEWREAFRKLKAGEDWESARKTFKRVSMQLIAKRIVGCSVPYVWQVKEDKDDH